MKSPNGPMGPIAFVSLDIPNVGNHISGSIAFDSHILTNCIWFCSGNASTILLQIVLDDQKKIFMLLIESRIEVPPAIFLRTRNQCFFFRFLDMLIVSLTSETRTDISYG